MAVPDVTGQQVGPATDRLHAAGFVVAQRAASGSFRRPGRSSSQTPAGGSLVTQGSTVTIGVAGG